MPKKEYEYDIMFLASLITQICDYAKEKGYEPNQVLARIGTQITASCDYATFMKWMKSDED